MADATLPAIRKPHAIVPNYQSRSEFEPYMQDKQSNDHMVCIIYFGGLYSDFHDVGMMLGLAEKMLREQKGVRFKFGGVIYQLGV